MAALTEIAPTAGQRYVQARHLRSVARLEIKKLLGTLDYMLTDAGSDPENARFAAGYRAEADLWERVATMASGEMDRWRDEARAYQLEWGKDDL